MPASKSSTSGARLGSMNCTSAIARVSRLRGTGRPARVNALCSGAQIGRCVGTFLTPRYSPSSRFARRLRVFFEEWDVPLISGIRWVEELVEIAGGAPIFPELRHAALAKDRVVDPAEVARRDPQVIFASWCGKKMKKAAITGRPGWNQVRAVRDDRIFEIKSTYILQPGPASLTEGVRQIHEVLTSLRRP